MKNCKDSHYSKPQFENNPLFNNTEVLCGNDGLIYRDRCHFSNSKCMDKSLSIASNNLCTGILKRKCQFFVTSTKT